MKISLLNPTKWRCFFSLLCDCISFLKAKRIDSGEMAARPWADLPPDLITLIADRLGIIDLLSFRGVCKGWNSAASGSSAQIESTPNCEPWFLLYGENSQCVLISRSDRKYNINIPELNGATCIASKAGWLLLHQESSIFFFCPFSHSKIDLPRFPNSGLSDHIAAFSSPPTSKDCIVSVVCQNDKLEVELHVLHRGANVWTMHKYTHSRGKVNKIKAIAYHDKTFQLYDDLDILLTFSPENGKWEIFRIVYRSSNKSQDTEPLPFTLSRRSFKLKNMNTKLGLGEDISVDTCGTVVPSDGRDMIFFNENISQQSETTRSLKGAWIEPRFYQIPPEVSW